MNFIQIIVATLGRICLSAIFILSSVQKFLNWHETEQAVITKINDLLHLLQGQEGLHGLVSAALPWSKELLVCAAAFELVGGLLVFSGYRVRFGAALLILFIIPTTFLFHHYWLLQGGDREIQMIMFLKNLSILGGLLVVLGMGAGRMGEISTPKPAAK